MGDLTALELDREWWSWVDANCRSKSARVRARWGHKNLFSYDGTTWTKDHHSMSSNSGKTSKTTALIFKGADGRVIGHDYGTPLNRRNDPARDWGLPD